MDAAPDDAQSAFQTVSLQDNSQDKCWLELQSAG